MSIYHKIRSKQNANRNKGQKKKRNIVNEDNISLYLSVFDFLADYSCSLNLLIASLWLLGYSL